MSDMGDLNFNAAEVEPNEGFTPIPAGEYDVIIVGSEVKPTANGTGKYLRLTLQVLTGPCQNRQLFENLNLWNPNQQTVDIAKGTLSAICRAVGILTPKDSSELMQKTLTIRVTVRPRKGEDGAFENRITSWKTRNGSAAQQPATASAGKPSGW